MRVDADPGQQMHQTISQMTVEVAALLACGTASVPSTGSTGVLGEPPGCHAAADAGLPAPAPLRIHEPGFAIPDLDSRAQAELYDVCVLRFSAILSKFTYSGATLPEQPPPSPTRGFFYTGIKLGWHWFQVLFKR